MQTCQHPGCDRKATHVPVLRFWAQGFPKIPSQAATAHLDLKLCRRHAAELKPDDFVTDEAWQRICQGVVLMLGKAMPDRASIEIDIRPVNQS